MTWKEVDKLLMVSFLIFRKKNLNNWKINNSVTINKANQLFESYNISSTWLKDNFENVRWGYLSSKYGMKDIKKFFFLLDSRSEVLAINRLIQKELWPWELLLHKHHHLSVLGTSFATVRYTYRVLNRGTPVCNKWSWLVLLLDVREHNCS